MKFTTLALMAALALTTSSVEGRYLEAAGETTPEESNTSDDEETGSKGKKFGMKTLRPMFDELIVLADAVDTDTASDEVLAVLAKANEIETELTAFDE